MSNLFSLACVCLFFIFPRSHSYVKSLTIDTGQHKLIFLIYLLQIIFLTASVLELAAGPELADIVGYCLTLQNWRKCFKNKQAS